MDKETTPKKPRLAFTGYQKFVIGALAFLQFSLILDFMIISPLGAMMMPTLHITPQQFGLAVSSYALSACVSGLLAAGFAARFDRKRLILFFYAGFMLGTLLCALAQTYPTLLVARIVTGLFGGVIGSGGMAIATDLFPLGMRGRVMGFLGTAFSAAQVLGLPAGLFFANHWDWHASFWAIICVAMPAGLIIAFLMKPVAAHLVLKQERSPFMHLVHTLSEPRYRLAFILTMLLPTGGYMLMPFGTAFMVGNLGLSFAMLPTIYLITGLFTVFVGPLVGKASDSYGKFNTFLFGSTLTFIMVAIWTNLSSAGIVTVIIVNVLMFIGIFSRMIPSSALMSAIPEPTKRGAFNSVSSSLQQLAGGISSAAAGALIIAEPGGRLGHFNRVGFAVMGVAVISATLMYFVHKQVPEPAPR